MRSALASAAIAHVLALASAGCLEGDPNPFAGGGDGGTTSGDVLSVVEPGALCAKTSVQKISLRFTNRTPSTTVKLMWVDFSCREVQFGTIAPGQSQEVQTFLSHPWRLRDATTNALYKEFVPSSFSVTEVSLP